MSQKEVRKSAAIQARRSITQSPVMKAYAFTRSDLGKYFVINPKRTSGRVMTADDLHKLNLKEIGEWDWITEYDVK